MRSSGICSIVCILGLEVLLKEAKKIGSPTACALEAPPGTTSKPPGATGSSGSRTVPSDLPDRTTLSIENLNPYSNNWTVKVLVAQKSEIRTWSNQRGEGKFFNVALLDDTGEIRGTCFNSTIIDELHGKLREGKVYYVSKAKVSPTKKEYNNTAHDFQLTLEKHTEVEEVKTQQSHSSNFTRRPFNLTIVAVCRPQEWRPSDQTRFRETWESHQQAKGFDMR